MVGETGVDRTMEGSLLYVRLPVQSTRTSVVGHIIHHQDSCVSPGEIQTRVLISDLTPSGHG